MRKSSAFVVVLSLTAALGSSLGAPAADPPHPARQWVKQHPRPDGAQAKPSPRMGYETTYGYDPASRLLIRYGGHNQGGGGEQNSEVWTYDLARDEWTHKMPNDAPPGVCCGQQNVFDEAAGLFVRFPAFSGSHGWQSWREIYLKNSSVWTYDVRTDTWRAMRPCPEVWPAPLRGAAYDPQRRVTVVHGGEGGRHGTAVYDLYANAWHDLKPQGGPETSVSQPGFTYDAAHRLFVLFGSQFASDERTWVYDLRANQWRALEVDRHPPADKSCPVLAADTRNGIVLCSVQGAEGLETWALDAAQRTWTKLELDRQPDPSGARNRVLVYLEDRNLFVLENRTKDEQQIWTFRWAEAPAPPARPATIAAAVDQGAVRLAWPAGAGGPCDVWRGEGRKPWEAEYRRIAEGVKEPSFVDRQVKPGAVYYYEFRPADAQGKEQPARFFARAQPPVVLDARAGVTSAKRVELEWPAAAPDAGLKYFVERAAVSVYSCDEVLRIKQRYGQGMETGAGRTRRIGPFARLTPQPIAGTKFVDDTADLAAGQREPPEPASGGTPLPADQVDPMGKPYPWAVYAYRVIAVNRLGAEGGPSPLVFTYPAAVEHVFAKEEGEVKTRLKWAASKQPGIAGYLVYRLDGRWDKDTITRLTPQPVQATEFLDETAGKGTRRYEVVAVDALGQQGEPSQPVWSRREWGRFYVPYVGQWHQ